MSKSCAIRIRPGRPGYIVLPSFKIRRATARDIDLLVEHRIGMFRDMAVGTEKELETMKKSYRPWALDLMGRRLFHGYIVTTKEGEAAASGCVWLREMQPSPGHPAGLIPYIMAVYTDPRFRRRGLATMVMEEAMAWGRKKGYDRALLHASRAGRRVYSRLGWERTWEMELAYE